MPNCAYCQGELAETAEVCGGCGRFVAGPGENSDILSSPESLGPDSLSAPTTVATHSGELPRRFVSSGICPGCGEELFSSDDVCSGCGRPVEMPAADSGVHTQVDLPSGVGATVIALKEDGDSDAPPAEESGVLTDAERPPEAAPTVVVRREEEEEGEEEASADQPAEDSGILSTGVAPSGAAPTIVAREEEEPAATCPVCQGELAKTDRVCGQCGRAVSSAFEEATVVSTDANALQTIAGAPTALAKAWLVVTRGCHPRVEYPLRPGPNLIGRSMEDVQIDLSDQESPDVALASRRHAVIRVEGEAITVEDLASLNGTFVNRTKIKPGVPIPLSFGDAVQIGTVLMELES